MTNPTHLQALLDKFERLLEKNKPDMYAMAWSEFHVLYRELRKASETTNTTESKPEAG
jgi:DNA repair ATPase RecN